MEDKEYLTAWISEKEKPRNETQLIFKSIIQEIFPEEQKSCIQMLKGSMDVW